MVFIPRQMGIEDTQCTYDATDSGTGAVVARAGVVVSYTGSNSNGTTKVKAVASGTTPQGILLQNVKHSYDGIAPQGFRFVGDLASTDAFVGDAVTVVHRDLGDTDQFDADSGGSITAGQALYAKDGGRLTNDSTLSVEADKVVAYAKVGLSAAAIAAGKRLTIRMVI